MRPLFRILTLIFALLIVTACASLQGSIASGRYTEPNGRFSYELPPGRLGKLVVRDYYNETIDRGLAEFGDDFGMTAVYFTHGPTSKLLTQSGDRRADLEMSLTNFAMPNIFVIRSSKSDEVQILHKEFVSVGGEEVLFVLVNIPGASGAWDMHTKKVFDAKVGALLFVRGEFIFVMSIQENMRDVNYKSEADLPSMAEHYRRYLTDFYDSPRFNFYNSP